MPRANPTTPAERTIRELISRGAEEIGGDHDAADRLFRNAIDVASSKAKLLKRSLRPGEVHLMIALHWDSAMPKTSFNMERSGFHFIEFALSGCERDPRKVSDAAIRAGVNYRLVGTNEALYRAASAYQLASEVLGRPTSDELSENTRRWLSARAQRLGLGAVYGLASEGDMRMVYEAFHMIRMDEGLVQYEAMMGIKKFLEGHSGADAEAKAHAIGTYVGILPLHIDALIAAARP